MAVLKLGGEAVLLTMLAGITIGIIGYLNQWDTSLKYSNAFFIAGCLLIFGGGFSRLNAGKERSAFQVLHAESFRHMSASEQAIFIIDISSSLRLVVLGLLSGILLFVISCFYKIVLIERLLCPWVRCYWDDSGNIPPSSARI